MKKEKLQKYVTVKYLKQKKEYTFLYPKEKITEGEQLLIANNLREIKVEVIKIFECPKMNNFKYKRFEIIERYNNDLKTSSKLITDPEIMKKRVINNPSNFELASDELKNNRDFVLKLMELVNKKRITYPKEGHLVLKYIGKNLKKDKDFALQALKYLNDDNMEFLLCFDEELLNDEEVIFNVLKRESLKKTIVYYYIGDKLKNDKDFLIKLLERKYNYISLLDNKIKGNFEFAYKLLNNPNLTFLFKYLNKNIRSNKELIELFNKNNRITKYKEYFIHVSKRNNKKLFYPINAHIMNKIIIDKNNLDLILRRENNGAEYIIDFTLLENSLQANQCNEEIIKNTDEINIKFVDGKYEIMFGCCNKNGCFNYIIELLFNKLKHDVSWNFEIYELLRHDEYHIEWGNYPQEIVRLFYEDGLVADEFLINQHYVNY